MRILTYCITCPSDLDLVIETDDDQVPDEPELWAELVENLTDDKVPAEHDATHILVHEPACPISRLAVPVRETPTPKLDALMDRADVFASLRSLADGSS